jgi:hypothetical protein
MGGEVRLVSADAIHVTVTSEPDNQTVSWMKVIGPDHRIALTFRKMNREPQAMLSGLLLDRKSLPRR